MTQDLSIKDYFISPIVLKLNDTSLAFRDHLINTIIDTCQPYKATNDQEQTLLKHLSTNNVVALTKDDVTCVYPISAIPTNKKVFLADGRQTYAMCAIDAIGCHYAFRQKIIIESECQKCHEKIVLQVDNGKITVLEGPSESHIYVLHADLQGQENWSCCCCNIMHFFSCRENLEQWLQENNVTSKVYAVDLETANKIAWLLFSK